MAAGGTGWGELAASDNEAVIVFDLVLLVAGTGFVIAASGLRSRPAPRPADQVAAE